VAIDFLKKADGSGRPLRPVQKQALEWISANWSSKVLCLNIPVGGGKSLLSKSIADATNGHVITPSNILIDQYVADYPNHNFLKGKHHYTCSSGISCHDWTNLCEQKPCPDCPYVENKFKALSESTFFNPLSLFYLTQDNRWSAPRTLILDEAHTLSSMILMLSGFSIPYKTYMFPKNCTNELVLIDWLDKQIVGLKRQISIHMRDKTKMQQLGSDLQAFTNTRNGIAENPQNYAIWTSKGVHRKRPEIFLNVKPLTPPRNLVNKLLDSRNLILMSGTLFPSDIKDLLGDVPYKLLDLPSPIPKERRPIYYRPVPFPMNVSTPAQKIVDAIEAKLALHPGENTIIHVTYALSQQIRRLFKQPILFNDKNDKDIIVEKFKKQGGVFLAAGCAEGIDLKGDLCRVNIIPKLPYPNLGDPVVAKRKALEDGDDWYTSCIFKTLIQQVGRSTRSETDFSTTYILDPNFGRKFAEYYSKLPTSFKEAVILHE
jgi:ATP-dependent DNA helicase DinG